jgi:hypothetical protein
VARVVVEEWSLGSVSWEEWAGEAVSCSLVRVLQGAFVSFVFEQQRSSPSVAEKHSTVTSKDKRGLWRCFLASVVARNKPEQRPSLSVLRVMQDSGVALASVTRKELEQRPFLLEIGSLRLSLDWVKQEGVPEVFWLGAGNKMEQALSLSRVVRAVV